LKDIAENIAEIIENGINKCIKLKNSGWLGVRVHAVPPIVAKQFKLKDKNGLLIVGIKHRFSQGF